MLLFSLSLSLSLSLPLISESSSEERFSKHSSSDSTLFLVHLMIEAADEGVSYKYISLLIINTHSPKRCRFFSMSFYTQAHPEAQSRSAREIDIDSNHTLKERVVHMK